MTRAPEHILDRIGQLDEKDEEVERFRVRPESTFSTAASETEMFVFQSYAMP